jgi:hypothetical protein
MVEGLPFANTFKINHPLVSIRFHWGCWNQIVSPRWLIMGNAQESLETAETQIPAGKMSGVRGPEPEGQAAADSLGSLLQRVAASSISEIDRLIDEMTAMRHLLQTEAERVQRQVIIYAHLSQSAMQTTKSIAENLDSHKVGRDGLKLVLDDDERCRATTGLRLDGDVTPRPRVNEDVESSGLHRAKAIRPK